jgi:hypothetical protein
MDNAAAIITALSVLTTAMAGAFTLIYITLRNVKGKIIDIDHAVNGKAPGEQSMVSQVEDIHAELPPKAVEEINGSAIAPLVRELYADMQARRKLEGG